jgi:hypothetical protein
MLSGAHPNFFKGSDHGCIRNLFLILKIMLQKPCRKYNITRSATIFMHIQI